MTAPRRPGPKVHYQAPAPLEDVGHLRMAAYLHSAFPGGNPRVILRDGKGNATRWEDPHPWFQWWHTPNQGQRSVQQGAKFVRMGMRAGVPDFALLVRLPVVLHPDSPRVQEGQLVRVTPPGHLTLAQAGFIEAKREAGPTSRAGSLSPGQVQFRDSVVPLGAWWAECQTVDDLDAALHLWLDPWGLTWPRPRNVGLSPVVKP